MILQHLSILSMKGHELGGLKIEENLRHYLLAIVCTVDYGNMFNRSRFLLKLNSLLCIHVRLVGNLLLKVYSIQFPYVLFNTFLSVRYNLCLELKFIINVCFGDISFP